MLHLSSFPRHASAADPGGRTLLRIVRRCRGHIAAAAIAIIAALAGPATAQEPAQAREGVVTIRPGNVVHDTATGLRRIEIAFPEAPSRRRLLAAQPDLSAAGTFLARLVARGAAGNHGDLYDNRDRGHAALKRQRFPTLTFVAYDEAAQALGIDYGLNHEIVFDAITIGNSSTAYKLGPPLSRSIFRGAMQNPRRMLGLTVLYGANHLYVYPEHRDHDRDNGDRFPAMTPHVVLSQGSSGSDQPFVRALSDILAALQPRTKSYLAERGLVAPTLQMLLRRNMTGVEDDADYMSATAHPSAFDAARIDRIRMMRMANALLPTEIPPRVVLRMMSEPDFDERATLFGGGLTERLFDTPDAIARVARATAGTRRYRLSVADTADPNGRPLRFHWRVLRGPGATVRPLDPQGLEAEVEISWSAPFPTPYRPGMLSRRAEIVVFADNGAHLSAPAFFTLAFPPAQNRRLDAQGRPLEIDYAPSEPPMENDPVLFPRRDWRDLYDYDADGRLLGWRRVRKGGAQDEYSVHGLRVLSRDALGRPEMAQPVAYRLEGFGGRRARIVEVEDGDPVRYRYAGPGDRTGLRGKP